VPDGKKPTTAELEILNVLWRLGPATVRQVHEELRRKRATGYTTVLKLMQIMTEKGLLKRDDSARAHLYRPAAGRGRTQRQMVRDLADRLFGGSAAALAIQALSNKPASRQELEEIRRMLDELERGGS